MRMRTGRARRSVACAILGESQYASPRLLDDDRTTRNQGRRLVVTLAGEAQRHCRPDRRHRRNAARHGLCHCERCAPGTRALYRHRGRRSDRAFWRHPRADLGPDRRVHRRFIDYHGAVRHCRVADGDVDGRLHFGRVRRDPSGFGDQIYPPPGHYGLHRGDRGDHLRRSMEGFLRFDADALGPALS